jgi:predicted O-methyltransferase YrrM
VDVEQALGVAEPHMRMPRALRLQRYLRRLRLASRDPWPDVEGMASVRKLRLLNALASRLPTDGSECYLEIGTFQGKSLIATLSGNGEVKAVACDNFSEWDNAAEPRNARALRANLARHGMADRVRFFDVDFRDLLSSWTTHELRPVGLYFFDGPHDEESQYAGIALAEPILADHALVVVDDWRHAADSGSRAEEGTRRAISQSQNMWEIMRVLPARRNGDRDLWWNGLGILQFERRSQVSAFPPRA